MSEQITEPNDFELHGKDIQISYSMDSLAGGPQLTYKTQKFDKQFKGNEIRVSETEIGKLITVTIENLLPDIEGELVKLTLLLPTINLPSNLETQFQTEGIFTTQFHKGFINHPIPEKQLETYEILSLEGTARRVDH